MGLKLWGSLGVLASVLASAGVAGAADLAVKAPVYKAPPVILSDWAGFYLGINGGGGFGSTSFDAEPQINAKPSGGMFGGQVGYNWQFGSVVVGVEGDFDGADINSTTNVFGGSISQKTDELATARTRLGYTILPRLLAYGTAGAAWGHSSLSAAPEAFDLNQFGWAAGAGLEYKLWGNFIARAEYLHYDFGGASVVPGLNVSETVDAVRGGLSYKF